MKPIDFRSDTVTQPTPAMRAAIAAAPVGDDVIDVDPTVQQLEQRVAKLLGKERAIFMPSGTMTNQVAVRIHCKPGDELICDEGCHIYNYEQGGFAQLSGVAVRTVASERGIMHVEQLDGKVRPDNEHFVRTRLLALENTHNRAGGRIQPWTQVEAVCRWARDHGLRTHLDGARLMNAVVATGIPTEQWSAPFDTVSVCFSKGLGAPVGSVLAGTSHWISEARRHRKLFGGGMRQGGILAAAALYALDHHVDRLQEDHQHAQQLATQISQTPGLSFPDERVDTNIVIFKVDRAWGTEVQFVDWLRSRGILMLTIGHQLVRAVTHLDISSENVHHACSILQQVPPRSP